MRRKRKCKVDSLFDLLTWKYRPLISAFHDFYDSWSLPYLEVTRRGECEMVLEKASPGHDFILPYRVREPEGQRTRAEPEPGERNSLKQGGNIEPRNEKGTSFNPISQLEFRIKRSAKPVDHRGMERLVLINESREIDFDRAAMEHKTGFRKIRIEQNIDLPIYLKGFRILSCSTQFSKNLGKEIRKKENRSNKRKSKRQ